jgi:hypothetical protein
MILKGGKVVVRTNCRFFSTVELPKINFEKYLNKSSGWKDECIKVKESLRNTGLLVVEDPVFDCLNKESKRRRQQGIYLYDGKIL